MPLLDSFKVDHTRMQAPAVRVAKTMLTPGKDTITVFDLRFCVPNQEILSEKGIHTLEHLFAGFMRDHLNGNGVEIIDISPMGCRTGFYMSLIGAPSEARVADAAVQYKSEAFHGEVLVAAMTPVDFNKYGCDLVWRLSEKDSGREVARGKTGIVFFDYTSRKMAPVPAAFRQRTEAL